MFSSSFFVGGSGIGDWSCLVCFWGLDGLFDTNLCVVENVLACVDCSTSRGISRQPMSLSSTGECPHYLVSSAPEREMRGWMMHLYFNCRLYLVHSANISLFTTQNFQVAPALDFPNTLLQSYSFHHCQMSSIPRI